MGRWGLTLIEIMIATALMAGLLVALWRLVGIYTSLRDKGEVHAGRVGNVSVMMQQLEEDLRNLPDVRPRTARTARTAPLVETAESHEMEAVPVANEAALFDEAYDDQPAVDTLSESALELESADRRAQVISRDEDPALSEEHSLDPYANSDADQYKAGQSATGLSVTGQRAQPGLARSEGPCTSGPVPAGGQVSASCLVGDEQSLTLSNLDCQVSRSVGETVEKQPQDLLAEHGGLQDLPAGELSGASGYGPPASQNEPGSGVTVQMPVRFVRYWLAGVMPLVAQEAADEYGRDDSEGIGLSAQGIGGAGGIGDSQEIGASGPMGISGEVETDEGATGLYREEVLGLGSPRRMRTLHGQGSLENLDSDGLSDFNNTTGMPGLNAPGFNGPYETEDSEEVTRRSFHLAQVEWAKFRYFDGNRWKSSWDSRVQGELPVAIEMSLWLLRQRAKRSTGSAPHETPTSPASGMTWTEVETMSEADSQLSVGQEDRQAGDADAQQSSLDDDNPMERQPEVRQLVVLRTAPLSGDRQLGDGQSGDGQSGDEQSGDRRSGDGRSGDGRSGDGGKPEANSNLSPTSSARIPQRTVHHTRPLGSAK